MSIGPGIRLNKTDLRVGTLKSISSIRALSERRIVRLRITALIFGPPGHVPWGVESLGYGMSRAGNKPYSLRVTARPSQKPADKSGAGLYVLSSEVVVGSADSGCA